MKPTTSEYILLKKSAIHHKGVFAKKVIPKDTMIIEYVGEIVRSEEGTKRADKHLEEAKQNRDLGGVYVFILDSNTDLDGSPDWNTAKYINHSCEPNCCFKIKEQRVFIYALHDIKKGEELTYNYGYDLDDFENHPCLCGSARCVGYIADEEDWPELKKKIEEKKLLPRPNIFK